MKEFDKDTLKKALRDIGIYEIGDLRPLAARPRGAGAEAPVPDARQVRRRRHDDRHAARAQSRQRDVQHQRRRRRDDQADPHRRQQDVRREAAARRADTDHAGLVHVVLEERPVLEAEAEHRPRVAAQLLPRSRLSRVQRRIDAGLDHAGQEGHLRHDQHHRRARSTRSPTSRSPARRWSPRKSCASWCCSSRARPTRARS